MTFQDSATSVMEGVIDLHHDIMFFMFLISFFVFWLIFYTVYAFNLDFCKYNKIRLPLKEVHGTLMEVV